MRKYKAFADALRAKWMTDFERAVTEQAPEHTGRIDWESATHLFNINADVTDAARQYINNRACRPEETPQ